jgi:hypothetical protein
MSGLIARCAPFFSRGAGKAHEAPMNRILTYQLPPSPRRVKIAGALGSAALALLAFDAALELQNVPAAQPVVVADAVVTAHPANVQTVSYYPEQLAALDSLATFHPSADSAAARPLESATTPADAKPIRHAEAAKILGPAKAAQAAKTAAAPMAAPSPQSDSVRIFGVAVPGAESIGGYVASAGDAAARWTATVTSLGGKLPGFWR